MLRHECLMQDGMPRGSSYQVIMHGTLVVRRHSFGEGKAQYFTENFK